MLKAASLATELLGTFMYASSELLAHGQPASPSQFDCRSLSAVRPDQRACVSRSGSARLWFCACSIGGASLDNIVEGCCRLVCMHSTLESFDGGTGPIFMFVRGFALSERDMLGQKTNTAQCHIRRTAQREMNTPCASKGTRKKRKKLTLFPNQISAVAPFREFRNEVVNNDK